MLKEIQKIIYLYMILKLIMIYLDFKQIIEINNNKDFLENFIKIINLLEMKMMFKIQIIYFIYLMI